MMECFMGCEPSSDGREQFYVMALPELTIYGHTIDEYTRAKYPEEWGETKALRKRGIEWGCWHSVACPDGEIASNSINVLRLVTYEQFVQAAEQGWPYTKEFTSLAPVTTVGTIDEYGRVKWEYSSSLDATLGPKNQG